MASLPSPTPGLVLHYRYLWGHEHDRGLEEARYARPCAIVLTVTPEPGDAPRVIVVPLTTREPEAGREALALPTGVRRALGLDAARSWVMLDEANEFIWPGVDLEPSPDGRFDYGVLPPVLYEQVRTRAIALVQAGGFRRIWRDS